jgi:hypothetical protein
LFTNHVELFQLIFFKLSMPYCPRVAGEGESHTFECTDVVYCRNELPWKKRLEEVCDQARDLLGDTCSHCALSQAGPECGGLVCAPLPLQVANNLFAEVPAPLPTEKDESQGGPHTSLGGAHTVVTLDNLTSPVHSLLQVTCKNRKGLLYDCLRTLKDMKLQVSSHLFALQFSLGLKSNGKSEVCCLQAFACCAEGFFLGLNVTRLMSESSHCFWECRTFEKTLPLILITSFYIYPLMGFSCCHCLRDGTMALWGHQVDFFHKRF